MTGRKRAMVNQADIAEKLGVSRSTVSRALRNDPSIGEEMRRNVQKLARELGYWRPYAPREQEVAGKRILLLGLGSSREQITNENFFFSRVLMSLAERVKEYQIDLEIIPVKVNRSLRSVIDQYRDQGNVIGIIIPTHSEIHTDDAVYLQGLSCPVVLINRYIRDCSIYSVMCDDFQAGQLATEYLLELGHRKIAHVRYAPSSMVLDNRYYGYQVALLKAGLYDPRLEIVVDKREKGVRRSTYEAMLKVFQAGIDFTAIVAVSDLAAMGVVDAALELGIRVPEDLSVTGFDYAKELYPSNMLLTSFDYPMEEMGRTALQIILNAGREALMPKACRILLAPRMIRGNSCAAPGM